MGTGHTLKAGGTYDITPAYRYDSRGDSMATETFGFVAFRSRQQTTALLTALKSAGVPCTIINTPHEIGMGCGLSVRFSLNDTKMIQSLLDRQRYSALIGVYTAENVAGRLVCKPLSRIMNWGNC